MKCPNVGGEQEGKINHTSSIRLRPSFFKQEPVCQSYSSPWRARFLHSGFSWKLVLDECFQWSDSDSWKGPLKMHQRMVIENAIVILPSSFLHLLSIQHLASKFSPMLRTVCYRSLLWRDDVQGESFFYMQSMTMIRRIAWSLSGDHDWCQHFPIHLQKCMQSLSGHNSCTSWSILLHRQSWVLGKVLSHV